VEGGKGQGCGNAFVIIRRLLVTSPTHIHGPFDSSRIHLFNYQMFSSAMTMFLNFVLVCGSCCSTMAALTRPASSIPRLSGEHALATFTSPSVPDYENHVELRAYPKQPSTTLATFFTTTLSAPLLARAETTIAPEIIGYTSTQGVCKSLISFWTNAIRVYCTTVNPTSHLTHPQTRPSTATTRAPTSPSQATPAAARKRRPTAPSTRNARTRAWSEMTSMR
jgi:hypothetical protein